MFITWLSRLRKCTSSLMLSRDYEINILGDEVVELLIHFNKKNTQITKLLCLIENAQPIRDHYKLRIIERML